MGEGRKGGRGREEERKGEGGREEGRKEIITLLLKSYSSHSNSTFVHMVVMCMLARCLH